MHWSFFVFSLVAFGGYMLGRILRSATEPPRWLREIV